MAYTEAEPDCPMSTHDVPLVIVHGLLGSHLDDPASCCCFQRRYVSVCRLFCGMICGCGDQFPLPTAYSTDNKTQQHDNLLPAGPIQDVYLCGCCPVTTVYTPLVQWAESSGRQTVLFSYDWRRTPAEAGAQLEDLLESLLSLSSRKSARGEAHRGAQLICHSNGALVAFPVMNRRPELFHSVVLAAGATAGGVAMLPELSVPGVGSSNVSGNTSMITPAHWFGWTAPYYFMPLQTERAALDRYHLAEADGTEVKCDFHNIADWKRLKIGPYHAESGVLMDHAAEEFFEETLKQAREYRQMMVAKPGVDYPPIAVIASACMDTVTTWCRATPDSPFCFEPTGEHQYKYKNSLTAPVRPFGRVCVADLCWLQEMVGST